MASDLLNQPKRNFLSQDDNWFSLRTNIPRPSAGFVLISISGNPAADTFFRLTIEGEEVEFTFATTPNLSGLQLHRRPAGSTLLEYRDLLIDDFRANERISDDFQIIPSGTPVAPEIRLVYKVVPGAVIAVAGSAVGFDAVFFQAQYNEDYLNLFGKVHVYEADGIKPLVKLRAAYAADRKAWFNMAGIFQKELGLPTETSLLSIFPGSNFEYEVHEPEGVTEYYLWHADSYGNPPTTERLEKEGPFYTVPGGSSGISRGFWGIGGYQLCHAYFAERSFSQFVKPITASQPDWMYLYISDHEDGTTIIPRLVITYSDGTIDSLDVPTSEAFVPEEKKLYCFPSGPKQIYLEGAPNWATKTATRYEFQIVRSDDVVMAKLGYKLMTDCQDWRIFYLAYENGAGGIESVAMRGKTTESYNVDRSTFRRAKTRERSLDRGEFTYFDTEAFRQYELPTGWYPKIYVEHLRQLLVAERVWLLDNISAKYLAVNVTTSQADLTTAGEDLHAMSIRIQLANPDINSHIL